MDEYEEYLNRWRERNKPQPERNAEIIRRFAAGGITKTKLAAEYGVCPERICQIVRRGP